MLPGFPLGIFPFWGPFPAVPPPPAAAAAAAPGATDAPQGSTEATQAAGKDNPCSPEAKYPPKIVKQSKMCKTMLHIVSLHLDCFFYLFFLLWDSLTSNQNVVLFVSSGSSQPTSSSADTAAAAAAAAAAPGSALPGFPFSFPPPPFPTAPWLPMPPPPPFSKHTLYCHREQNEYIQAMNSIAENK